MKFQEYFRYAIDKGCRKSALKTFHDYAVENKRLCSNGGYKNGIHKCSDSSKCHYNTNDISKFDVTKLYPLISSACEDIERHGADELALMNLNVGKLNIQIVLKIS